MSKFKPETYEKKWQDEWRKAKVYQAEEQSTKPKYYVLDMFPYPSGAGLHVGHPLGYIASDIVARYYRHKGYNVLHPMGYDAFGLPAEQYAIQTGQHPAKTTEKNIERYREQLDNIGFSFDWSREVRTSDPEYYKWTQWIFLKLYGSWYNPKKDKAEPIEELIRKFEAKGFEGYKEDILTGDIEHDITGFSAEEWKTYNAEQKEAVLQNFRLAYLSETFVNWCPALGTVLAHDEVKDGLSERGGYPVERKLMKQWSLRITAYSERLLEGLNTIDWSESIKETQRNWIGKSVGASVHFQLEDSESGIEVFTTRPDTIFGVSFLTLAPENELVANITTSDRKDQVEAYVNMAKNRSERERMADVKTISGEFTGAYAIHPFNGKKVPVWVGDYVLVGYGTGAVMGVPAHDSRDHAFASHFQLPIIEVVKGKEAWDIQKESFDAKEGILQNSDFLNGLDVKAAINKAGEEIEKAGIGKRTTNYRLRDAVFGRQRYWGEPIPIYYEKGVPHPVKEEHLEQIKLPAIDKFLPTEDGDPPLARASVWNYDPEKGLVKNGEGYPLELTTMPGWAGSSWYFLRYADPNNKNEFASKEATDYWKQVDLYLGGSEHATGHLLYARFWTKVLYDLGYIGFDEPFRKLINQGMIQGMSALIYRDDSGKYISKNLLKGNETAIHIDVNLIKGSNEELDLEGLKRWKSEFANATFELEEGKYICGREVEKMSKRWHNVVNPDDMVSKYGADTLRLYEMFLGPLQDSKPWNTNGIEGVYRFLGKLWKLFVDENGNKLITNDEPTPEQLKVLHKTIKKVTEDIDRYSFNTSVSTFMIAVNELTALKCHSKKVLDHLLILLSPYAPHVAEELWHISGNSGFVVQQVFPLFDENYLTESSFDYPVSINGKTRTNINLSLDMDQASVQETVLANETVQKWMEGKDVKKFIFVKGRIVNIVL